MYQPLIRQKARLLRAEGKTYKEILTTLKLDVSKSTIAAWCRDVSLPPRYADKITDLRLQSFKKMRAAFQKNKEEKNKRFLDELRVRNKSSIKLYKESIPAKKLVVAVLYLAEGSKNKSSIMFGNSDPFVIKLFVDLLRKCYKIDESKFRCTVQCRADQDVKKLEAFWSRLCNIPLTQFYKARVDPRTVGKTSRKKDYKGVCRVDYFSAALDKELKYIARQIMGL